MKTIKKVTSSILLGSIVLGMNVFSNSAVNANENEKFTATSAEEESYWYSRYNLGNLVMRSGMGERYIPDMEMVIKALMMVDSDFDKGEFIKGNDNYGDGDHPRPPVNPFLIKSVFKSGDPHYITKFNASDFATQAWDESKMDKSLTPEAFAYTIQKEVEWAKDFHGEEHFGKTIDNFGSYWRFVGMMMNMNAKMQAKYAMEHKEELDRNNSIKDHYAMLGAISDLASMMQDDKFEANHNNRYKDNDAAMMFGNMADQIFSENIKPTNITEYSVAIKSLVWYAKFTKNAKNKKIALNKIIDFSNSLVDMDTEKASKKAYRLTGLIEAYRVTGVNSDISKEASQDFLDYFDNNLNLFKGQNTYTIDEVGTIIGALNEIKLFIVDDTTQAEEVFRDFFENVVNKSGLLHSAPPLQIAKSKWEYEGEPVNYFRYPDAKVPPMAGGTFGVAPVFATEVSFLNNEWKVTNSNFDSAGAMHASNEMIWLHYDELNGFPELYKLDYKDKKLLSKLSMIVSKMSDTGIKKLKTRIKLLYSNNDGNIRLINILKELEKIL